MSRPLAVVLFALSIVFALSFPCSASITIPTVPVGDPGNVGEWSGVQAGGNGPSRICGAVGYAYNIGKYEVTVAQYTHFLNAVARTDTYGVYTSAMGRPNSQYGGCGITRSGTSGSYTYSVATDFINRPVTFASFWNAVRFANWLHNGQPTGLQNASTTEDGAYYINGYNGRDGRTIQRKAGWKWAITSEDEWYKAAYYKGGGTSAGYWDYPTRSNVAPGQDMNDPSGNNANYWTTPYNYPIDSGVYYTTVAGQFHNSASPYGTFDQGGNLFEYNDTVVSTGADYAYRGYRGGSYASQETGLRASYRNYIYPDGSGNAGQIGFRVAAAIPEPSSLMILAGGVGMILGIRRRKA